MTKYNFFELKKKYSSDELPEDVNIISLQIADKVDSSGLLKEKLNNARKLKLFGKIIHYGIFKIDDKEIVLDHVIFKFRFGIVQEFTIKKLLDKFNIEERNVINNNVSFKKTR